MPVTLPSFVRSIYLWLLVPFCCSTSDDREFFLPLGQPISHSLPVGSGSDSASDPSASVPGIMNPSADLGSSPPMTPDDVKLIFGNITEIAIFSDLFCQALEEALGDLLQGGKGSDHVGALFLSIVRVVFYIFIHSFIHQWS